MFFSLLTQIKSNNILPINNSIAFDLLNVILKNKKLSKSLTIVYSKSVLYLKKAQSHQFVLKKNSFKDYIIHS